MKIIVFSDSHGRLNDMLEIYNIEKPQVVLFAGDHSKDCIELSYIKEEAQYYIVKGNTDIEDYKTPEKLLFNILGKKIFLTHGHLYHVKKTYEYIIKEAENIEADLTIFGHTHIQDKFEKNGRIFFNPGALKDGYYGVMEIKDGKANIEKKRY